MAGNVLVPGEEPGQSENMLAPGSPTMADAMDATMAVVKGWRDTQRQKSVEMGLLDPATGMPTAAGWKAAGEAVAQGFGANNIGMIRAYHGSPHSFDRFDMSKIGTGEGAQAYGHGLYFAGNEGVARGYRDALKWKGADWQDPQSVAAFWLKNKGSPEAAIDYLQSVPRANQTAAVRDAAELLRSGVPITGTSPNPGSMYEVALHTTPDRLLDWDKPLGAQGAPVYDAVNRLGRDPATAIPRVADDMRGADFYRALVGQQRYSHPSYSTGTLPPPDWQPPPGAPAEALRSAGIPGLQYLDAGSRGAGEGTHNYVMFDPKIIEILRKYGIVGTTTGAAVNQLVPDQSQ